MTEKLIANRFELKKKLGQGAQATVFLARDITTNQNVALKLLSAKMTTSTKNVKRFQREFSVCKNWDNPNIIKLYDSGLDENAGYFYTMEYLPYPTIDDRMQEKGSLSDLETFDMLLQLAKGLEVAHKDGIIHRDIKPENVIIGPDDRFILVDFGLARDLEATALTATGTVLGTPYLMAPEMIMGERVDLRADIYSLGVLAWYSLTKQYPYNGDTIPTLLCKIVEDKEPPNLSELKPTVHSGLTEVIQSMMIKDPDSRIQNCGELHKILSKALKPNASYTPITTDSQVSLDIQRIGMAGKKNRTTKKDRKKGLATKDNKKGRTTSGKTTKGSNPESLPTGTEIKNTGGKRTILMVLLLLIVLCAIAYRHLSPQKIEYSYSKLTSISEPHLIFVQWTSTHPYKSILETSSPLKRIFEGREDKPVKDHKVIMGPFKDSKVCNFKIVYPDGRKSLAHSAKTRELTIEFPPLKYDGPRLFSIKSSLSKDVKIKLENSNGAVSTIEGRKERDNWILPLPENLGNSEKCTLLLSYPSGNVTTLNLPELFTSQLPIVKGSLINADLELFRKHINKKTDDALIDIVPKELERLKKASTSQLSEEQMDRVRKVAGGKAIRVIDQVFSISETYYKELKWFPLIFDSGLIPLEKQQGAYSSFCAAIEFSIFAEGKKCIPSLIFTNYPESIGSFTTSVSKTMDLKGIKPIFETSNRMAMVLSPLTIKFWGGKVKKKELSAVINDLQSVTEAELILYLNPFRRFFIHFIINGNRRIQAVCHPYLAKDYTEAEKVYLRQRIPLEYLKNGENNIEIRAKQALINGKKDKTSITKIWLNLKRKPD